jgi:hypothetical protein
MTQWKIPKTPFYVAADVNSMYAYSVESAQAVKDVAYAEVSLPINVMPYFTIKPYYQGIYRDTHFFQKGDLYEGYDDYVDEFWYKWGGTFTSNIFSPRFYKNWYHHIVPMVDWTTLWKYNGNYYDDQPNFPIIVTEDIWTNTNDITPALSNFIRDDNGNPIVELTLKRTYSLVIDDWGYFGGVFRFNPWPWMTLEHYNTFGEDEHNALISQQNKTSLTLRDNRSDSLSMTSEYLRQVEGDSANNLYGNAKLYVTGGLWLMFEGKFNFATDRFEFLRQGIDYKSQCWGVAFWVMVEPSYELTVDQTEPSKTTFSLTISLLGLGDISGKHRETGSAD